MIGLDLASVWWVWLAGALVFGIVEMLLPGFVFLGFAIGAGVVALMLWQLELGLSLPVLLLIFAGFSLAAWLVLRWLFRGPKGQKRIIRRDINE